MNKHILFAFIILFSFGMNAQKRKKGNTSDFKTEMVNHYSKFYKTMLRNNDYVSAIQGLNHLIILEPEKTTRKDTLGLLYYTVDNPILAIRILGTSNSQLALKTKALSFRKLNNAKEAMKNYEALLEKYYDVNDAYELAQLQFGAQNFGDAKNTINTALSRAKDEKVQIVIAKNSYIETPIAAAFLNILGLIEFNNNVANIDKAVSIFDKALAIDPEFVLALENKKGLLEKKQTGK